MPIHEVESSRDTDQIHACKKAWTQVLGARELIGGSLEREGIALTLDKPRIGYQDESDPRSWEVGADVRLEFTVDPVTPRAIIDEIRNNLSFAADKLASKGLAARFADQVPAAPSGPLGDLERALAAHDHAAAMKACRALRSQPAHKGPQPGRFYLEANLTTEQYQPVVEALALCGDMTAEEKLAHICRWFAAKGAAA